MSEQQQQSVQSVLSKEDQERINNAFFAKSVKPLPLGVLIQAVRKEESIDVAISNADVADIYNAINGESPFDEEQDSLQ